MNKLGLAAIGCAAIALSLPTPAMAGPLHDAARAGDGAALQQALRDGANVDERNEAGETALFLAAQGGWYSGHDQLLVAGADPTIRDNHGLTVLHAAASSGSANVVAGLIGEDHHATTIDIDSHDNDLGVTPLAVAAEGDHANMVAYLVSHDADPEIADKAGLTPLTKAGQKGYEKVIAVLLRIGAVCQDIDPAWKADCDKRRAELGL